jgi:hypothetical protein
MVARYHPQAGDHTMKMICDQTFANDHLYEVVKEFHQGISSLEYFGEGSHGDGGHDGLAVRFFPGSASRSWSGLFAFGSLAPRALSGVIVLPNQQVLVMARGTGYLVDPTHTRAPSEIIPNPIMGVLVVAHARLVLVADPWSVFAFGDGGQLWNTGRIAIDGLSLTEVSKDQVLGEIDVSADETRIFSIDLITGKCMGAERLSER